MIVKKVSRSRTKHKASSIRALTDYIRDPRNQNPDEKVLYANGRGFLCDSHEAQREEMVALASESVRSKDPVNHYILSWREGEQPSPEQVEAAVSIFLEELGWKEHQAIYGLHKDTDNIHLHLAVNRVHPETLKVVEINRGFDIEMAHMAIARIEHAQGWQREQNGRYHVLENGELGRGPYDPEAPRRPSQQKQDMENRTGEKSAHRVAIEDGAAILRNAQSWAALHAALAAQGMRYERTGSGATVFVGDVGVKASDVDRAASLSKLQQRLGVYRPASQQPLVERAPEPIRPDVPGWEDYITGRRAHYAEKQATKVEQDQRQEKERKLLQVQQQARRRELMPGDWTGNGVALNAMRSVIAAEQAAEKAALKERHQREREQLRQRFRPYPDLESWQRMQGRPGLADQWRHRASEPQGIEGEGDERPMPRDIRAYRAEIVGPQVHYRRRDEVGVSFVDRGRRIDIHDWRNRDSTVAALQLAAQKWGSFTVTGNAEYQAMCATLAAEHGFQIRNPELQGRIQQERERLAAVRAEALKSEPLKQFERYAAAVGAERYRVSSIRTWENGRRQIFLLDPREGLTPAEVAQRMPEIQRLQRRGECLHYTPLSAATHHVLIGDLSRERLDRLLQDGYQPAVVLESSPSTHQALLTVPKLGTAHDPVVGQRLSEVLNREYGDPTRSGAFQPHPALGYENRAPQHRREDGSAPEVRLVQAEPVVCTKALALSRQLDAEQSASKVEERPAPPALEIGSRDVVEVYQRHYRDVVQRQSGPLDLSRVDAMIAVRMRVTGHGQTAIERAIRQGAPAIRPTAERRDWDDYAQRTARYAYSAAADRQVVDLEKYREPWARLEGREVRDRSGELGR